MNTNESTQDHDTIEKPLVIYHGNCQDGFGAAWACWTANPDWEFYPGVHGNPPPDVAGRIVYLLDFSYKRPVLEAMADVAQGIKIFDHHVSARADLEAAFCPGRIEGKFDMNKSGSTLAWEYFHPTEPTPKLLLHIEDRDLWRFKDQDTRDISAALFSYEYNFEEWTYLADLCRRAPEILIGEGRAIERRHNRDVAELVKALRRRIVIAGVEVWAANIPFTHTSDAGHLMCDEGTPFAACYWDTAEGRVFSLRSRDGGSDVTEIAKLFGGGGHRNAAGLRLDHGVSPEVVA